MEHTELLDLPYIMPSQAQKHVTHNEAIRMLDAIVQLGIKSRSVDEPPGAPAAGDRYIVPPDASGAWVGQSGTLAAFQDGAWTFLAPRDGWACWCEDESAIVVRSAGEWLTLMSTEGLSDLPVLGVNATADTANRLAVASAASLFNHEGGSHRLKINRGGSVDAASVVFQTGFIGNAEFGLAGDDFQVKVSPDGADWIEAVSVDCATGEARFPATEAIASVASVRFTDQFETNSTSYVPVPGLSLAVTPKSAQSRFLIFVAISGYHKDNFSGFVRLKRDSTEILSGVAASLQNAVTAFMDLGSSQNWTIATRFNLGIDAPATTSEVVYSIEVKTGSAAEPVYINRNHQASYTSNYLAIPASSITIMEISK